MTVITDKELYGAALKLGKHLEFSSFLKESRLLMREYAPLEKVLLAGFSPVTSMMTIISIADREGVHEIGGKLKVPADAAKTLGGMGPPVSMLKRASGSVPAKLLIEKGLLAGDRSLIIMRMIMRKNTIGLLFCTTEPGKEFAREHGAVIAELRPLFSLGIGNCLLHKTVITRHQRLKEDVDYFSNLQINQVNREVVGASMGLNLVMQDVRRLAPTDSHIGIAGEQGSGRSFIARKIHGLSTRQGKPFIEINCHQIPEKQLEERLIGSACLSAGYSGGYKKGLLLQAAGGTVYLQGIGLIPAELQEKLSKIIKKKEIIDKEKKERFACDVRFITFFDSEQERAMLLGETLGSIVIEIPPLRDRKEDIPRLAAYFSEQACRKMNRLPILEIENESIERCLSYDWPGNVRELENIIERGVLLAGDDHIVLTGLLPNNGVQTDAEEMQGGDLNLDRLVIHHIIKALKHTGGKVGGPDGAAALLGINPSTLRKRMRKLKIPFGRKTSYE